MALDPISLIKRETIISNGSQTAHTAECVEPITPAGIVGLINNFQAHNPAFSHEQSLAAARARIQNAVRTPSYPIEKLHPQGSETIGVDQSNTGKVEILATATKKLAKAA